MFLQGPGWLIRSALIMVVVTAVPTLPPIFRQVIRLLWRWKHRKRNTSAGQAATSELAFPNRVLTWRLWFLGWMGMGLGWLLLAASLWTLLLGRRLACPPSGTMDMAWGPRQLGGSNSVGGGGIRVADPRGSRGSRVRPFLFGRAVDGGGAGFGRCRLDAIGVAVGRVYIGGRQWRAANVRQLRANQAKPAQDDSPPL